MSTKRKTLKQKRLNDMRQPRQASVSETHSVSPTYSLTYPVSLVTQKKDSKPKPLYTFNFADLRRSMLVSTILIAINSIIYVLLANQILPLRIFGL